MKREIEFYTIDFQIWRSDYLIHFPNSKVLTTDLYNGFKAGLTSIHFKIIKP